MLPLGTSLKQWREHRRFSLVELARVSHVDYNTLYRAEHGKHQSMRWDDIYKVSQALGIETLGQLAEGVPHDG